MPQTRSSFMTFALGILLSVAAVSGRSEAGPFTIPAGAPPIAMPLPPPVPAIGSLFTPPTLVPEAIGAPVWTQWEIDIGHFGPGTWSVNDPAIIQDSPFRDHLNFRIPLNNVPPPGALPPWQLFIVFGANPWGFASPFAFRMTSLDPFFLTPAIPEPFAIGSWAYSLVLTDVTGVVLDTLDPVLITGSTLPPTVPATVPEPGTLLLLGGGLSALITRRVRRAGSPSRSCRRTT